MTFPDFCLLSEHLLKVASLSLGLRPNFNKLVVDYVRQVVCISVAWILHVAIKIELRAVDKVSHDFKEEGAMFSI